MKTFMDLSGGTRPDLQVTFEIARCASPPETITIIHISLAPQYFEFEFEFKFASTIQTICTIRIIFFKNASPQIVSSLGFYTSLYREFP